MNIVKTLYFITLLTTTLTASLVTPTQKEILCFFNLIKQKCETTQEAHHRYTSLEKMILEGFPINIKSNEGHTPLQLASRIGDYALINLLLNVGSKPSR